MVEVNEVNRTAGAERARSVARNAQGEVKFTQTNQMSKSVTGTDQITFYTTFDSGLFDRFELTIGQASGSVSAVRNGSTVSTTDLPATLVETATENKRKWTFGFSLSDLPVRTISSTGTTGTANFSFTPDNSTVITRTYTLSGTPNVVSGRFSFTATDSSRAVDGTASLLINGQTLTTNDTFSGSYFETIIYTLSSSVSNTQSDPVVSFRVDAVNQGWSFTWYDRTVKALEEYAQATVKASKNEVDRIR